MEATTRCLRNKGIKDNRLRVLGPVTGLPPVLASRSAGVVVRKSAICLACCSDVLGGADRSTMSRWPRFWSKR